MAENRDSGTINGSAIDQGPQLVTAGCDCENYARLGCGSALSAGRDPGYSGFYNARVENDMPNAEHGWPEAVLCARIGKPG